MRFQKLGFILRNALGTFRVLTAYKYCILHMSDFTATFWHLCQYFVTISRYYNKYSRYPVRNGSNNFLPNPFDLESLQLKQQHSTVLFPYKLIHGYRCCPGLLHQMQFTVANNNLRTAPDFWLNFPAINILLYSIVNVLMFRIYNSIRYYTDKYKRSVKVELH